MGSLPRPPRLSDEEIIARYQAGESRGMLGLRSKAGDSVILAILRTAGVELRTPTEVKAATTRARLETQSRRARRGRYGPRR